MAAIVWSPESLDDLEDICRYVAKDSPRGAQAFARRVRDAVGRLAGFPGLGRMVPEYGRENIRELIVGRYRVIYRSSPAEVEIVTVIHGARRLPDIDPR